MSERSARSPRHENSAQQAARANVGAAPRHGSSLNDRRKMKIVTAILAFTYVALVTACSSLPPPGRAYAPELFASEPVLIQRGEQFFLRYRMAVERGLAPVRSLVVVKKEEEKGVAYLTAPISSTEYGQMVELPLAYYGVTEFARSGRFFWRNPDGTEIPLRTIKEE